MGNFIRFILQNLHFIIFIILEIISINLAINFNNRRKSIFMSTSGYVTGYLQSHISNASQYFNLDTENDKLTRENANLHNQILNMKQRIDLLQTKPDSLTIPLSKNHPAARYRVIPAEIISNSFSSPYNFLTVSAGKNMGVKPGMGVITGDGPVGIVTSVTRNYAKILSVYNIETSISAKVKSNNALGIIQWEPYNLEKVVMREIPRHVELKIGDTIVTSGYSFSFPPGLPIGTIDHFNLESGENDYTVYVNLFEKLYTLSACYIVDDSWSDPETDKTVQRTGHNIQ